MELKISVSDRAAAERYLQTALDDPEVQEALRRAASAGRRAYRRARGKSPGEAVKDKRLRRRAQKAAVAFWELVEAIDTAQAPRKRRRGRRAMLALAVIAGGYGLYLLSNGEPLRNVFNHDASTLGSHAK